VNRFRYFHFGQRGPRFMCAPNRTHNDCAGGDDLKPTQYSEAAISQRQIWILKKHVSRLACVIWWSVGSRTSFDPNSARTTQTVSLSFRLDTWRLLTNWIVKAGH
jgi:hypothetical protein